MRAIDADRLLQKKRMQTYYPLPNGDVAIPLINIINAPTVEPNRQVGEWIMRDYQSEEDTDNGNYLYTCSVCGRSDLHARTQEVPYCWWCGSLMKGVDDGEMA